jgi:hypothetical protein
MQAGRSALVVTTASCKSIIRLGIARRVTSTRDPGSANTHICTIAQLEARGDCDLAGVHGLMTAVPAHTTIPAYMLQQPLWQNAPNNSNVIKKVMLSLELCGLLKTGEQPSWTHRRNDGSVRYHDFQLCHTLEFQVKSTSFHSRRGSYASD